MNGSDSSSDQTTASSARRNGFRCTLCSRSFSSGHSLSGHQTVHLLERAFKRKTPNILASAPNRPLPSSDDDSSDDTTDDDDMDEFTEEVLADDDDEDSLSSDSSLGGSSSSINGPPPSPNGIDFLLAVEESSRIFRRVHHVSQGQAEDEYRRNRLTQNLVGEWETLAQMKENEAATRTGEALSMDYGSIDLDLSLKTAPFPLDLDLKLGF